MTTTLTNALLARLRGRAETARRNCDALLDAGYAAEALLHQARSEAYALAAEDVEALAREARPIDWPLKAEEWARLDDVGGEDDRGE